MAKTNAKMISKNHPCKNNLNAATREMRNIATVTSVCSPIGLPANTSVKYPIINDKIAPWAAE